MSDPIRRTVPSRSRQRGVAAVELAILLPFLLLLVLGTAEFGRAFFQYNTLTKAVRNGARFLSANVLLGTSTGVIPNPIPAQLVTQIQNLVVCGQIACGNNPAFVSGLTSSNVTITRLNGQFIRVTVNYPYQPMLFPNSLPTFGLGNPIPLNFNLQASVVMRALL